jgi:hypothetical protein
LLLTPAEFRRTLDVFPLEYGEIIAKHVIIAGADPFAGADVADADRRRACEQQAKSHLIHLREGFLENGRDPRNVEWLIARSVPAFRRLLANITCENYPQLKSDANFQRLQDELAGTRAGSRSRACATTSRCSSTTRFAAASRRT